MSTTIAKVMKKDVSFLANNGHTYRFDFKPNIGDVNRNPEKYEQYRVKNEEEIATTPEPPPKTVSFDEVTLNGKTYRKVTGDEEVIELNGTKYRAV